MSFAWNVNAIHNSLKKKIQLEVLNLQLYRPWQSFILFADYNQIVSEPVEA